jgi:uncharacterized membrane protein
MAYFNAEEQEKIKKAIHEAESQTSGEIRVLIEKKCKIHPIERAAFFFKKLKMQDTFHKNGVLIYLASEDKKYAIIGDSGIHNLTGNHFWEEIKHSMHGYFKSGQLLEGVLHAINETGNKLKSLFPYEPNKPNELPDDILDRG